MKSAIISRLLSGVALFVGAEPVRADGFHFLPDEIPADEVRLLELGRIREFRATYELGEFSQGTLLIAELYEDGRATKVFRLSRAKYDSVKRTLTGTLSFGWNRDRHHLVSLNDNGDFHTPWPAKIELRDFSPSDAFYFRDSVPEVRKPEGGGMEFKLYPVVGLCGERTALIRDSEMKTRDDFLKACREAGARNALMIYMYMSPFDEEPPLKFEEAK
jgi:hypothetical protein